MLRHDSRKYAVVNGNENTLSGNLNSRVIQLVITKNLTLANAGSILDLVRTNKTGSSTAFPFFATSEFLTLGFAWEVSKLVANTSVVNGGNYTVSPPPPPPNLWQLFWNTIAGWAERAWNAVVAVGAFFYNLGKWLATAAIGFAVQLAQTVWANFQKYALEPVRKALEALVKFIVDLVTTALRVFADKVLKPLVQGIKDTANRVVSAILLALAIKSKIDQMATDAFLSALPILIFAATAIVLVMIGVGMTIQSFPIVGLIIAAIVVVVLWAVFLALIPKDPKAADSSDTLGFLAHFDTTYGSGLFLFSAFGVWATPISEAIPIIDAAPGPGDIKVLAAVLFSLLTFGVDGVGLAVDRTPSACSVGILALVLSGLDLALSIAAVLKFPKNRGYGTIIAYVILTGSLTLLAGLSFGGDSGYVLRNCG